MLTPLKKLYRDVIAADFESARILRFVKACVSSPDARVLDVGCGYGRNLTRMLEAGMQATGVEVNPHIVQDNRDRGLPCLSVEEFKVQPGGYDVIVMSHIIEHFPPDDLKVMVDDYLDSLAPGGHLVVATPLTTSYFFDDYDHVKPYHPVGFLMVFGGAEAQVQYYARNRLRLKDIWFRRSAYLPRFNRGQYIPSMTSPIWRLLEFLGGLSFVASGGYVGKKDAWVGVFEKVEQRPNS